MSDPSPDVIWRTESAYDSPLLVKNMFAAPLVDDPDQEIVYRGELRLTYREVPRAGRPARRRPGRPGRQAGRHRRRDRLGQPPLPRVLLRHTHDRRRPAHGERAPVARAARLHDRPRRGRRPPGQRRVPAPARAHQGPHRHGQAVRPDRQTTERPVTTLRFAGEYEALLAAATPMTEFPDFDENTRATTFYTTGTTGHAQGRLLQPPPARAAHPGDARHDQLRHAGQTSAAKTSTCRSRRCSTSTPGASPTSPPCSGVKQVYPGKYVPERAAQADRRPRRSPSRTASRPSSPCWSATRPPAQVDLSHWKVLIGGAALPKAVAPRGARPRHRHLRRLRHVGDLPGAGR